MEFTDKTKEAREIADAFYKGRTRTMKRTRTSGEGVELFNHLIAWREDTGLIWLTLCGWPTVTTRDRLNAILARYGAEFRFCQKKFDQYLYFFKTGEMREISAHENIPLAEGPLAQLAIEAERREKLAA